MDKITLLEKCISNVRFTIYELYETLEELEHRRDEALKSSMEEEYDG